MFLDLNIVSSNPSCRSNVLQRCRVEVRFRPQLSDEAIREEACRLIRMRKEAEAEAEYEKRLEEERLAAEEAEKVKKTIYETELSTTLFSVKIITETYGKSLVKAAKTECL